MNPWSLERRMRMRIFSLRRFRRSFSSDFGGRRRLPEAVSVGSLTTAFAVFFAAFLATFLVVDFLAMNEYLKVELGSVLDGRFH